MAESPTHKWGQIIGQEFLEVAVEPLLRECARKHGLYLDKKGPRPARKGKKIVWKDLYGNTHDLDYVLERGGGRTRIGVPVAFIEIAWRRYTKHSRNKAQEIQGAVLRLAMTHQRHAPFIGVILAGEFTAGALSQLRSLGFTVLHFSYHAIISAFRRAGIDASFGEDTPDAECLNKIKSWQALSARKRAALGQRLLAASDAEVRDFVQALERAITRRIEMIRVLPLHGQASELDSIESAVQFIREYREASTTAIPIERYEILLRHGNGDEITGLFADKTDAIQFLLSYQTPLLPATGAENTE